jgi:hypothetical protein
MDFDWGSDVSKAIELNDKRIRRRGKGGVGRGRGRPEKRKKINEYGDLQEEPIKTCRIYQKDINAIQLNISKRKGESYPDYLHRVLFGDTRFNVALVADSERAYDLQLENIQVRSNLEKEKQRNRELEYNFQRC